VPFIDQSFYTGPLVGPLGGIDISWVVGGVAGVVCYLVALQVPSRDPEPDPLPGGSWAS
jgi:nucleobase:cation symporter-1, NCS1 family